MLAPDFAIAFTAPIKAPGIALPKSMWIRTVKTLICSGGSPHIDEI